MGGHYDDLAMQFTTQSFELSGVYQVELSANGVYGGTQYRRTTRNALIVPLRGEAVFCFTNSSGETNEISLEPGRAMLGGYDQHLEVRTGETNFEYVVIHYSAELIPYAPEEHSSSRVSTNIVELPYEPTGMLLQWLGELRRASSQSRGLSRLEEKSKFFQIISYLLVSANESERDNSLSEMESIVNFIHHHYMEPLTLGQLAKLSGFNPKYFSRRFEHFVGTSPMQYLIQLRMDFAYDMLSSGFYSVREVAEHVGYHDPYYFSRLFKGRKGISPGILKSRSK